MGLRAAVSSVCLKAGSIFGVLRVFNFARLMEQFKQPIHEVVSVVTTNVTALTSWLDLSLEARWTCLHGVERGSRAFTKRLVGRIDLCDVV